VDGKGDQKNCLWWTGVEGRDAFMSWRMMMMNGGSEDMLCQVNRSQSNIMAQKSRNMEPDDCLNTHLQMVHTKCQYS
jgi:hypothetical protein